MLMARKLAVFLRIGAFCVSPIESLPVTLQGAVVEDFKLVKI
jgi:hypothetical protein